ncbi:MAG: hypothetical protein H6Q68_2856 [Firmicutes bacterium]|nr:hypothetical protein [Bacillota bacterium]
MKFPIGKGFDLSGGILITVVLDEYALTGTFLGGSEERHHDAQPIHVNVEVEEETEFILLQLTCPLEVEDGPDFPIGTIIAINVQKILFIAPGGVCVEATT